MRHFFLFNKIIQFFKKIAYLAITHKQEFFLCLLVFLVPLFVYLNITVVDFINRKIEERKISAIKLSIDNELKTALEKTKEAAYEGTIDRYIANNDEINTSVILQELAKKYSLTAMVAVDKKGVAIARVPSPRTGDYVAQTTLWGRRAIKGETVVSIGAARNYPLVINSAVPISKNGKVEGALYGGHILDNAYALNFKQKYLESGEEVSFYSAQTGIYGNSFERVKSQRLLNIFFSEGSDWVRKTKSELGKTRFRIDGDVFHVGNLAFHDLDGNLVGGVLVFFPVNPYLSYVGVWLIGLILFFFCLIHLIKKHKSNKLVQIGAFFTTLLLIVLSAKVGVNIANRNEYDLTKSPNTIYNSTITLSPESDFFDKTKEQRVAIQITSGGEAINSAEALIKYDPQLIRVEDILTINSFCDQFFIIEKIINNEKGEVKIACGKPNGFLGKTAILAELLIQPLKTGELNIQFGEDTQVLANDGLGTNVLRTITNGTYQIIDFKTQGNGKAQAPLFSYSHPNAARWYSQKNIHIDWPPLFGYEDFIFEFNQTPDTILNGINHTANTSIDITANKDGVYYFHLAPRVGGFIGKISHLKIMVDTTEPSRPLIKASATKIKIGEIVRFEFVNSGDNLSGLQKNFYIKFNEGMWFPTPSQLYTPFLEKGTHRVTLRVFDNAGNFNDSEIEITVY